LGTVYKTIMGFKYQGLIDLLYWTTEDCIIVARLNLSSHDIVTKIVSDSVDYEVMLQLEHCKSKGPLARRVELTLKNK